MENNKTQTEAKMKTYEMYCGNMVIDYCEATSADTALALYAKEGVTMAKAIC